MHGTFTLNYWYLCIVMGMHVGYNIFNWLISFSISIVIIPTFVLIQNDVLSLTYSIKKSSNDCFQMSFYFQMLAHISCNILSLDILSLHFVPKPWYMTRISIHHKVLYFDKGNISLFTFSCLCNWQNWTTATIITIWWLNCVFQTQLAYLLAMVVSWLNNLVKGRVHVLERYW